MTRLMKGLVWVVSAVALAGCATGVVATVRLPLEPKPNDCQVSEVRPTGFSTLALSVCWDSTGRAVGMVGGAGKPAVALPLEVISALGSLAGPVVGAVLLGSRIGDLKSEVTITVGP